MVQLYQDGGAFMHPLLLLMLIGIALGLFKLFQLYRVRRSSRPFINEIAPDLAHQSFPQVIERCASTPGPVASVIRSGLLSRRKGIDTMRSIMSAVRDIEYAFLERGLSWLNFIIVIAPLLGFTGTVWGMVIAFQQIRIEDDISPAVVAGGISQALLTTLFGLIVAMIVHFFHNICTTINMEKGLKMVLPGLEELPVKPKNIINVLVNAEGKMLFNGQAATMEELKKLAREILEENDLVIFSLQTSRATPYEYYIKALDALKEAGAKRISIADPAEE